MGISGEIALAAAQTYTDESLVGGGAIKGKNCTIKSIAPITGGNRVTFEWTLDDGTVETDTMDVMDGTDGSSFFVTPQMYGAKADGTTDDTEAILSAITAGARAVYIPKGEYLVSWNTLTVTLASAQALTIFGDSKYSTKLHLTDARETYVGGGYGLYVKAGNSGEGIIDIHDLGIYHDNQDPEVTYTTDAYNLLLLEGQFKEVNIDNVYIHSGYNATLETAAPYNNCLWARAGADTLSITNSLFENFGNMEKGGCLWINPSNWSTKFTYGHVEIRGNEFRHTCGDEILAIWALSTNGFTDDEFNVRDVSVIDNTFLHMNFNGTCYKTNFPINIEPKLSNTILPARYLISGNKIVLEKSCLGVFQFECLDQVVIADNDIHIKSIEAQSQANTWAIMLPSGSRAIFRHNSFRNDATSGTTQINFVSRKSAVEIIDNYLASSSTVRFYFQSWTGSKYNFPDTSLGEFGAAISLVGNVIEKANLAGTFTNNTLYNIIDNKIDGYFSFPNNQTAGSYINIRGNQFKYREASIVEKDYNGRDIRYINNYGIKLIVKDSVITSPVANFVYVGRKEDLVFKIGNNIVPDSPSVRAQFFTSSDITYILDPVIPNAPTTDGTYTLQATVSSGAVTYSWV